MAAELGRSPSPTSSLNMQSASISYPGLPARPSGRKPRPRVPDEKRKRASRACNECRRKKEKCDGKVNCDRCVKYRVKCYYGTSKPDRPLSQPTDANAVPRDVHTTNDQFSNEEKLRCMEKIFAHCLVGESLDDQEIRELAARLPDRPSILQNPSSQLHVQEPEFSRIRLESPHQSVDLAQQSPDSYEDLSLTAFTRTLKTAMVEKLDAAIPEDSEHIPGTPESEKTGPNEVQLEAVAAALNCFPPQEIAQFLLDVFFRYVQTSIYYVEESWAYRFIEGCYSEPSDLAVDDVPSLCTILMVMGCGTQFAHLESFRLNEEMAKDPSEQFQFSEDNIGQRFHQVARTLMPYILTTPTLRSVQACVMMATYNFSLDSAGASYTYLSLALSLAIQQGMHHGRQDVNPDDTAIEIRKRTWWTVYILHIQVSIKYGRPMLLRRNEITLEKPKDVPDLRSSKEASTFANLLGLIDLTLTTQAISEEIAQLRRTNKSIHFLNLLSIRQKLIHWWENFPGNDRRWECDADARRLRNDIHLRLYYWNTRLSLGRPFLLSKSAIDVPEQGTTHLIGLDSLKHDSVSGALEVVSLCQLLRDRVGLARASYVTEFTSCRTAMLVLLAQGMANPNTEIREALSRGLEILRIMAIGSTLASSEVRVIEVLERAAKRLETAIKRNPQNTSDLKSRGKTSYDAFRAWSRLWQSSSGLTPTESSTSPASNLGHNNTQNLQHPIGNVDAVDPYNLLNSRGDEEMIFGSLPLELSQFDIIPGLAGEHFASSGFGGEEDDMGTSTGRFQDSPAFNGNSYDNYTM